MKIFFRKICFLFIIYGCYLLALQLLISWRISGKSINGQDNLEQCANRNADVVFVGNSRCITSFMPKRFQNKGIKAINLGLHGHPSLSFVERRISDYLRRNRKQPKVICINFDVFSVSKKEQSILMKDRFARYAFMPKKADLIMLDYFGFDWAERNIPAYALLKYRKLSDAMVLNNQSQWLSIGMETESKQICGNEQIQSSKELKSIYRKKKDDILLMKELRALNINYKNMGITLLAVQVPVFESIYNNRFMATKKICQDAGVPFIDLAFEQYNNDCSLFKDLNHLNTKGARLISDSVARYIQTNMLIKSKNCNPCAD
jgi:hypothetical protein